MPHVHLLKNRNERRPRRPVRPSDGAELGRPAGRVASRFGVKRPSNEAWVFARQRRDGRTQRRALSLVAVLALVVASACDRTPSSGPITEWTRADHDGEKTAGGNSKQGAKGSAGSTPSLVEVTWRNQCAACHGLQGRGDGPQGPMFKAPDLGQEAWQASVKDEDIASAITNGKGRMPKFELPDEVVRGLVTRVRSFRAR